jgi:hypothetical protein
VAVVTRPAVRLHVDELELDGLDPATRHDVARGLQGELARLFAEHGVPPRLGAPAAAVEPIVLDRTVAPIELGRAVARALFEGWR